MSVIPGNIHSPAEIISGFDKLGYVVDEELATILFLMNRMEKPVLLEGNPGVGKTEVANIWAEWLGVPLIRLQCYEGLDVNTAVYEWNYQKQLLTIQIQAQSGKSEQEKTEFIFSEEFLMERPLLKAISSKSGSPVLLIDEIDRADEEFEAFLLELLSAFQISIPEIGTIKAENKPFVILTSNRTRELSDALRRRCLYQWVNYPNLEKEIEIISKHLPDINIDLTRQLVVYVQELRKEKLEKTPGIAETLDWARGILALGYSNLDRVSLEKSLGCLLKSATDIERIKSGQMDHLLAGVE